MVVLVPGGRVDADPQSGGGVMVATAAAVSHTALVRDAVAAWLAWRVTYTERRPELMTDDEWSAYLSGRYRAMVAALDALAAASEER